MSTLQQTEQATPSVPAASTQLLYPKVGGQFVMASDGIEKQLLDSRNVAMYHPVLETYLMGIGGF